jgi:NADH-quinone oxidoreductase subunit L
VNPFWLIPFPPAASALILFLAGRKLGRKFIAWQASLSVALSFVLAVVSFAGLLGAPPGESVLGKTLFTWIEAGDFRADLAFRFDPLAAVMVLVVTGVGLLIHIYSAGYMAHDRSFARYFACLNLFTFAMLVLVLASNMILMFVGWEGVGLCSYLLIGFWYEKPAAASAGKKAFLVNRIGDAGFIVGVLLLLTAIGTTSFAAIDQAVAGQVLPPALATVIALCLFVGATGKSAQLPLYVWLPDAMEGPTPVSALIHAATMVTAGVYMVARLNVLYTYSFTAASVVAIVGALTAVFAATMALTQNDIKRVLAYSTISQLGYMFLGCGVGAYAAGIFHLATHAFFKSLLFLAAGSVMHALSGELDMRKMGGLKKYLPRTYPAFLIGAVAISGVPFLSGFFSKDAILSSAFAQGRYAVWALGLAGAVMTAFYMFRLVFQTFHGRERLEPEAKRHLHESPPTMTVPLLILAFFSVIAGYIGLPAVVGKNANLFDRFLEPILGTGPGIPHLAAFAEWSLIAASVAAAGLGIALAYLFYLRNPQIPHRIVARFPRVYKLLSGKYFVDEIYDAAVVVPIVSGSSWIYRKFDLGVIDASVDGSAASAGFFGRVLALLQTGLIKDYALAILLGAAILLGVVFFSP